MGSDTAWLTRSVTSDTRKPALIAVASLIPEEWKPAAGVGGKRTRADFIEYIREARRAYWDADKGSAGAPVKRKAAPRRGRNMTASEANEFLRSLPPVPSYPDLCQCPLCKAARGEEG